MPAASALCLVLCLALAGTAGTVGAATTSPTSTGAPVQDDFFSAFAYSLAHPRAQPAGANDFSCTPSAAHPRPVVLVNGTFETMYANWSRLSPQLARDGYCVYAFNYGGTPGSPIQQLGPMRDSGPQLAAFVDRVLAATNAANVDLVSHSQGSLLSMYYINRLGGAPKVHRTVGIEPISQGVHLHGLAALLAKLPGAADLLAAGCAACIDFTAGSAFLRLVAQGGYTRPGVRYTTIISRTDGLIAVPEAQLPPAPNVTNIVTQNICPRDFTDHVNAAYDDITLRIARNALDPAHAIKPTCRLVLPLFPPQTAANAHPSGHVEVRQNESTKEGGRL